MRRKPTPKRGKRLIFRPYITVNGQRIYPRKGRVFPIWVDDDDKE